MPERDGSLGLETLDIISNGTYAANGYPHAAWTRLRREDPIHWNDRNIINPFWAVTKHADIVWISKQPERFLNGPRLRRVPRVRSARGRSPVVRHLLNMDPPDHARFRKLASHRFTPRGLERMRRDIEQITRDLLDAMMGDGGDQQGDFVERLSAPLPLQVLAELLGVPREMWPTMFDWTNRVIGSADPEYQEAGDDAFRTAQKARLSLFGYFSEMARERRAKPSDDIVEPRGERDDRRRVAARARAALVLLPARRRRQRDHAQRDDRRTARVPREPRAMGAAARRSRARSTRRWRRSCAGPRP